MFMPRFYPGKVRLKRLQQFGSAAKGIVSVSSTPLSAHQMAGHDGEAAARTFPFEGPKVGVVLDPCPRAISLEARWTPGNLRPDICSYERQR